jgi:RNA polymerase-binding transcription factor DksA
MLEECDSRIRLKLDNVREGPQLEANGATDAEDRIQTGVLREIDVSLLEKEAEARARIEEALRRVGRSNERCTRCGGQIGRARLRAVPFTDVCRACKEKEESAGLGPGRRTPLIRP